MNSLHKLSFSCDAILDRSLSELEYQLYIPEKNKFFIFLSTRNPLIFKLVNVKRNIRKNICTLGLLNLFVDLMYLL
jgi:hypothetical protein